MSERQRTVEREAEAKILSHLKRNPAAPLRFSDIEELSDGASVETFRRVVWLLVERGCLRFNKDHSVELVPAGQEATG